MILARFDDTEYPKQNITHIRHTVRIILKNEGNKYIFLKIKGNDIFGERNHIETIGGGIEGYESMEHALLREVNEETGMNLKEYTYLGTIIDRYYSINRETHSHFFVGTIDTTDHRDLPLTDLEKQLYDGIVELTEDEVLEELQHPKTKIAHNIYQRDRFAFEVARKKK